MLHPSLYIIAAVDAKRGIGQKGVIPWRIKKDINFFKQITTSACIPETEHLFGILADLPGLSAKPKNPLSYQKNAVIMGRKTWESIPKKFRPLTNRFNIILSRNLDYSAREADVATSFEDAIDIANNKSAKHIFIIGGGEIYRQALKSGQCSRIYITQITRSFECDSRFPEIPGIYKKVSNSPLYSEGDISFSFEKYTK